MADILDPEAHFCWDLAFKESRHSALCPLCRDLVLGHCCWHFALVGHILEALNYRYAILLTVNESFSVLYVFKFDLLHLPK